PGRSRMTIAIRGDDGHLRQVLAQLERLIDVLDVEDLDAVPHVEVELALVELDPPADATAEQAVRTAIAEAGGEPLTTHASGWRARLTTSPHRLDRAIETLRSHGLRRLVRAGSVAMTTPHAPTNGASPS